MLSTTNPPSSTLELPPPLPQCPMAHSTTCTTTALPNPAPDHPPAPTYAIQASPFPAQYLRLNKFRPHTASTPRSLLFPSRVTPTSHSREYTIPTTLRPCRRARNLRRCSSTSTPPFPNPTAMRLNSLNQSSLTCIRRSSRDQYRRARSPLLLSSRSSNSPCLARTNRKYKCRLRNSSSRNSAAPRFPSRSLYPLAGPTAYSLQLTTTDRC
jgi:hypothetical protein